MRKIQSIASAVFILAIVFLTIVSVLGVWDFFDKDVIVKSFQTLGLLAVVAVVVLVAGRFLQNKSENGEQEIIVAPNPIFGTIRRITLGILIVSVSFLALLGVLAIWDVIADRDVLFKSLGSLAVLAFGSFLIVMTCLEREGSKMFSRSNQNHSGPPMALVIVLILVLMFLFSFGGWFF